MSFFPSRRAAILALGLSLSMIAGPVFAEGVKPFNQAEFDQKRAAGQPMVMAVHAWWCGTCRSQKSALDQIMAKPDYKTFTVFTVNYDKDKALLKTYKVQKQSTMIVFKGQTETARTVGETSLTDIAATFNTAR